MTSSPKTIKSLLSVRFQRKFQPQTDNGFWKNMDIVYSQPMRDSSNQKRIFPGQRGIYLGMGEISQDMELRTALRRKNARNPNFVTDVLCVKRTELLPEIPKQKLSILASTVKERNNVRVLRGRVENGNTDELVLLLAWDGLFDDKHKHNRPQSLSKVLDLVRDLATRHHYSIGSHRIFAGGPGYQGYPEFMSFYVRPADKELFEHAFADFESKTALMCTAAPQACSMTGGDWDDNPVSKNGMEA